MSQRGLSVSVPSALVHYDFEYACVVQLYLGSHGRHRFQNSHVRTYHHSCLSLSLLLLRGLPLVLHAFESVSVQTQNADYHCFLSDRLYMETQIHGVEMWYSYRYRCYGCKHVGLAGLLCAWLNGVENCSC